MIILIWILQYFGWPKILIWNIEMKRLRRTCGVVAKEVGSQSILGPNPNQEKTYIICGL